MNKKILAAAAAVLMLGTCTLPVYAAKTAPASYVSEENGKDTEAMKNALTAVKKRCAVPAEYTDFDHSEYKGIFNFTWTEPDSGNYVTMETDGKYITHFYLSDINNSVPVRFGRLSDSELKASAEKYIKALNPDLPYGISLEISSRGISAAGVTMSFSLTSNGIALNGYSGHITVDRDTGKLYVLDMDGTFNRKPDLVSPSNRKTDAELDGIIKSNMQLEPYYGYIYDGDKIYGKLYYDVSFKSDVSQLDAFTGKKPTIESDKKKYGIYGDNSKLTYGDFDFSDDVEYETTAAADMNGFFTDEELTALELDKTLIQKGDISKYLKDDKVIVFDKDLKLTKADIEKYYLNSGAKIDCWNAEFTAKRKGSTVTLDVLLDARSGKIIEFTKDISYDHNVTYQPLSVSDGEKLAENAAKHFAGNDFATFKLTEKPEGDTFKGSADYVYSRYVNGIKVAGDTITVTVRSNKSVFSYSGDYQAEGKVEFEDASALISADKAKEFAITNNLPETKYYWFFDRDNKIHSYIIRTYNTDFIINGTTGAVVSSFWYITNETRLTADYPDIKNTETEKYVKKLADYGIFISNSSSFEPDKSISEKDFSRLLSDISYGPVYYYSDGTAEFPAEADLPDGINPTDDPASNRFIAKCYVETLTNYSGLNELNGIFKQPFTDIPETDPDCGYIAVAKALGYANGKDGKFDPDRTYTRAEAAKLIYDYLSSDGGNGAVIPL